MFKCVSDAWLFIFVSRHLYRFLIILLVGSKTQTVVVFFEKVRRKLGCCLFYYKNECLLLKFS